MAGTTHRWSGYQLHQQMHTQHSLSSKAFSQAHIEFSTVYIKTEINNLRKSAHVSVFGVQDKSGNGPKSNLRHLDTRFFF